jgi:hypothetical protein
VLGGLAMLAKESGLTVRKNTEFKVKIDFFKGCRVDLEKVALFYKENGFEKEKKLFSYERCKLYANLR